MRRPRRFVLLLACVGIALTAAEAGAQGKAIVKDAIEVGPSGPTWW